MAETVNLPGLGSVKKGYAIAGGVAVVGGFYVIYKRQQKANATASAGANTGIDPATGYAYGSPEDAAALTAQGTYVNPGTGAGGIGGTTGYVPPGQTGSAVPQAFRNNAEWTQYVIDYMQNHDIVTSDAPLGSALGKYITGVVPTADETSLINQAVAIAGYPPISGPDGYPPSIRTGTTTPPPPTSQPPATPHPVTPTPIQVTPPTEIIGPGQARSHTNITAGETVAPVLAFFDNMTQQQMDTWNPGITYYNSPVGLKFNVSRTVIVKGGKGW